MRLEPEQQDEIARRARRDPPTRRATVPALEEILYEPLAGARSRFRPGHRLYGRRCRGGAGGARLLRPGHQAGQRGSGPDQLSDAPSPYDALRDVRDQIPRQIADLRRPAVDPPPHRQRQRIFGALFDPRQRILHPGRRSISRRRRRPTARGAARFSMAQRRGACSTCCARTPSAPITAMPSC